MAQRAEKTLVGIFHFGTQNPIKFKEAGSSTIENGFVVRAIMLVVQN